MRSLLFVPGDDERKLAKGLASAADALILDLEDSVSQQRKPAARGLCAEVLRTAKTDKILYVRINALEHPMERVTTHKISYRPNEFFRFQGLDDGFRERRRAKPVTIGHDVWIGHGAVIMPGITIGHGAVIGANAVVTRDVEPYMVVAGVPAKVLRPRFDPSVVERLLVLQWWDWTEDRIFSAIGDMQALSITEFLDKWETA